MEPYDKLITLKSNELKRATEDDKKKITSVINKLQEEKKSTIYSKTLVFLYIHHHLKKTLILKFLFK